MANPNQNQFYPNFGSPNMAGSSSSSPNRPNIQPHNLLQDFTNAQQQQEMFHQWLQTQQYPQFPNQFSQFASSPNLFSQFASSPNIFSQFTPLQEDEVQELRNEIQEESRGKSQQPNVKSRKDHKKREKSAVKEPHHKKLWTLGEEEWLARCWIDTSVNLTKGNSQRGTTFWGTVQEKFNGNGSGWLRSDDQLSSKWRHMDKACKDFTGLYKEEERNPRRSGRNEKDVYEVAVTNFHARYGKWCYKQAWDFLKDQPKWYIQPAISGRRRTSEVELDDEDEANVEVNLGEDRTTNLEEVFRGDAHTRPMGRDKAKKVAKSSASSDAGNSSRGTNSSRVDEIASKWGELKETEVEKRNTSLEAIVREERRRSAMEVVNKLYSIDLDKIADPKERKRARKFKKKMEAEYADLLGDSSEDDED